MQEAISETLQKLGLTKNEALVYSTLLNLKQARAGEITSKCGVHRRNVYDALERLEEKALVGSVVKNNRRQFQPSPPQRLAEIEQERLQVVSQAVPVLEKMLEKSQSKRGVLVYTGINGYKGVFHDILASLQPGGQWLSMPISYNIGIAKLLPQFLDQTHARRVRRKISLRAIHNSDPASRKRAKEVSLDKLTSVRTLPLGEQMPIGLHIYGEKTALVLVAENQEPVIIVIESNETANAFRQFFELLWRQATPVR